MKRARIFCGLPLLIVLGGCPPGPGPVSCACDEFPFPAACQSKCGVGETVVESVNVKEKTAMVEIRRGAVTEMRTVPLSALPAGQAVEKGASFRALFRKETAAPGAGGVVHFAVK